MMYSPEHVFLPKDLESLVEDCLVLQRAFDFLERGVHYEGHGHSLYTVPLAIIFTSDSISGFGIKTRCTNPNIYALVTARD